MGSEETSKVGFGESPAPRAIEHEGHAPRNPRGLGSSALKAQDVTEQFQRAAGVLSTGDLVKHDDFTLFEAVGALEIMDPKMDSGFLAEGERLEDDYDLLQELLPVEILGIMDQLLCFEMAWHMGFPLSQSLFTSLYIDKLLWPEPKTLEEAVFDHAGFQTQRKGLVHQVLRPFCLGVIKTCDFIVKRISAQHYYEEEDIVLNLYNRDLLSKFNLASILELLRDAQTYIVTPSSNLDDPVKKAIVTRLEFRSHLLQAVNSDVQVAQSQAEYLINCISLLPAIKETYRLGEPVSECFSAKLQRKLASTVPPRPIADVRFEHAFDVLARLCESAKNAYGILEYFGGIQLQNFASSFQSQIPQPPAFVRSLLQSLIFSDMKVLGTMSFKKLIFDDLEEIVLPEDVVLDEANSEVEAPQDPRFQISRIMRDFLSKSADGYIDMFRTLCMNRSRLRRMLCHLVLDWDGIQYDAENLDADLRRYTGEQPIREGSEDLWSFPLSSWAYLHKLQQLAWIVQMGFELDVYQTDELGGMYWYLQYLSQARLSHLDRIGAFVLHRLQTSPPRTQAHRQPFRRTLSYLDTAKTEASATRSLASGLANIYTALSTLGLIRPPYQGYPYSSPELRYTLRMRPFLSISLPEVPSYEDFITHVGATAAALEPLTSTTPTTAQKEQEREAISHALILLDHADQDIRSARTEWEALSKLNAETARIQACEQWWRAGVKDVLRSAIKASIVVTTARKVLNNINSGASMTTKTGKGGSSGGGGRGTGGGDVRTKLGVYVDVGGAGDTDTDTDTGESKAKEKGPAQMKAKAKAQGKGKGKGKGYHAWWVVPDVFAVSPSSTSAPLS